MPRAAEAPPPPVFPDRNRLPGRPPISSRLAGISCRAVASRPYPDSVHRWIATRISGIRCPAMSDLANVLSGDAPNVSLTESFPCLRRVRQRGGAARACGRGDGHAGLRRLPAGRHPLLLRPCTVLRSRVVIRRFSAASSTRAVRRPFASWWRRRWLALVLLRCGCPRLSQPPARAAGRSGTAVLACAAWSGRAAALPPRPARRCLVRRQPAVRRMC